MSLVESAPIKANDSVPFVYGSCAFSLGKSDDGTTHRWTIYVRGVQGRDLTSVISKVTFTLHPTCTDPYIECLQHPFETAQSGWGEFPATIQITFKDDKQSTVTLTHHLRLHHVSGVVQLNRPVVHETYDEVVFKNPGMEFFEKLQHLKYAPTPHHALSSYWKTFTPETDLEAIYKAHAFVKSQLEIAMKEYAEAESELSKITAPAIDTGEGQASNAGGDAKRLKLEGVSAT